MSAHIDTFAKDRLPARDTWPEFIFGDDVPPYPNVLNAAAVLLDNGHPENDAIKMGDICWSYSELDKISNDVALTLVDDYGLVPGNRVLLRGDNSPMLAALWFGVLKAGCIVVTTMTMLRQKELDGIIGVCEPDMIIMENDLSIDLLSSSRGKAKHVVSYNDIQGKMNGKSGQYDVVQTASDDVAILAFTSGTTGLPKATMHFHRDILAMADTFSKYTLKMKSDDVVCGSPPLAFTFGLGGLLVFPARVGACVVYLEKPGPDAILDTIEKHKVTTLFTAPTAYKVLTGQVHERDISSLKTCISAGENLPKSVSDDFYDATGIRLIDGIGATEMIHVFISASGDDIRPGATGKVVPGFIAEILDDDGNPLPDGEAGRLAIKGPTGCRYLNGDRQGNYVENGWNITGDIFKRDQDGYFWFVARGDDIIISSGYNIAAPEVEQAVMAHDAVQECAVIGAPDEDRGTIVKAFIVLKSGFKGDDDLIKDIQDFVKSIVAPYKYPRAIEFIDALPKSATGKLLRKDLKN
ncbi:AMP-binding protein [Pseudemcibacter aquimaris]|uniref:AMP-binding protein n=1 Tax=Pseudemcibacter aquimaris TaxID=2857064 RepID=UPI002010DBD1|nr:AMP-binding protein [Pseudemcibacter aquimaris]MCC3861556.1 AMP-binding protein [Pseudemcibacter aquimaris]WDU58325.1 AMP-binding protein [Pseudemcibacter aquimaris]